MPDHNNDSRSICLITVTRNNPEHLRATCLSVVGQTESPAAHIVLDGSDEHFAVVAEQIAKEAGANYEWRPPRGIYNAMSEALNLADEYDYVWFINATDYLASEKSLSTVSSHLEAHRGASDPVWLVGQTIHPDNPSHRGRWCQSGEEFGRELRRGRLGIPHSSTIVATKALRAVNAFAGKYRISKDYEMGLELLNRFGPPLMVHSPLSVYDESGESAQNAWRNVLHKSEARIKNQPWWHLPVEPFRITAAGRRELLRRRLRKDPGNEGLWRALGWERIDPDMAKPFWEREGA